MRAAAALVIDALFGEPPARLHPTVWMGWGISLLEERALKLRSPLGRRMAGVFIAAAVPATSSLLALAVLRCMPPALRGVLEWALISTTLCPRGLGEAALAVERALERGDLEKARNLAGEMVGRDTHHLSGGEVARAAVESVAENTSDGVVAPVFYACLFGAPGALAYRAANTLDSMLGYTRPPYGELGWASARLDDLANLLPARLTVLAAAAASGRPGPVLAAARRYGPLHSSPNAGRVEAAFAGALGIRLGGRNYYWGVPNEGRFLGDGRPPEARDIRRAVRLMRRTCLLAALAAVLAEALRRG
ncbi:cobalamin biosynthesis protein CobD [Rubrobacter taiwanensis]|uniref:Cobalamin biosynthesis protein CobD n=1 Tax=Rubrobacter taiwanensis TaxID=185139 RepID=A0A4R1B9Q1_9ACTN|nr:adenosylcobinamide-phosphate synthase CbiB [Rubrobacter taiwanensis]TCJ13634.1 cobalamin biosynthesis protein CobD [Rubrobacter taiwanensis]